ncbi:MAG: bifunctional demethylmenaquinone methyltransferase/2-methoxy-6-polyprenyl-1,4-benzoquinol methylase UbiE [Myxococcota bacterium]
MNDASVWQMFDALATRYDRINRVLSLGQDRKWRRVMLQHLPAGDALQLLDVATGTGDVLLDLVQHCQRINKAVGVDMAQQMLQLAQHNKACGMQLAHVSWQQGNAMQLPFAAATFHVVTMAFGIRNTSDPQRVLQQIHRVLKPGGRALILEFSLPSSAWLRGGYMLYLRHIVPLLGGMLSGQKQAYRYLNQSIEQFATPQKMLYWMQQAGFENLHVVSMNLGTVTLYCGDRHLA